MADAKLEKEYQEIADIQDKEEKSILEKGNVVGVGVGHKIKSEKETGDTCLTIYVSHKLDKKLLKKDDLVPDNVGKYKTDVIETGEIFAGDMMPAAEGQAGIQPLRERVRPAMGGYSVGHPRVTAGTIATGAFDATPYPGIPERFYILSNNHVIANSNDANVGDPILQPGRVDGGTQPNDVIGKLTKWIPIKFDGSNNLVDAAIAEAEFHDINREIYWNGYVEGYSEGGGRLTRRLPWYPDMDIGDIVRKTGRTTSYTSGELTGFNATINVNFGGGKVARFVRQIVTGRMSAGGDSGSLVTDYDGNAVGLLFAGSSTRTILNPIYFVRRLLRIRLF